MSKILEITVAFAAVLRTMSLEEFILCQNCVPPEYTIDMNTIKAMVNDLTEKEEFVVNKLMDRMFEIELDKRLNNILS